MNDQYTWKEQHESDYGSKITCVERHTGKQVAEIFRVGKPKGSVNRYYPTVKGYRLPLFSQSSLRVSKNVCLRALKEMERERNRIDNMNRIQRAAHGQPNTVDSIRSAKKHTKLLTAKV